MATITQQAIVLDSQNQVRNADRLAREWAIAHAGVYQGQARRELGGSEPFREWRRDNLTIRISKPSSPMVKQGQIISVRYEPSGNSEPYVCYLMTYTSADSERPVGRFVSIAVVPDALSNGELPWDEKAGPEGLEAIIAEVNADRSRPAVSGDGRLAVSAIDDLFAHHDTAIVLTEDGQQDDELGELADIHSDWAARVGITAAEQLRIGRELPDHQLAAWLRAKIAVFSRYDDAGGSRLRMTDTDWQLATAFLDEERTRSVSDVASRNSLALLEILEATCDHPPAASPPADVADQPADSEPVPSDTGASQQRVYILEDQLDEANALIAELRERLAQYESYEPEDDAGADEDEDLSPESVLDGNRYDAVVRAVTEPARFPRLRFLNNWEKALADYGKPRPSGTEIVSALDAINKLAQAWHNTPGGSIGPWDNYFNGLTGWTHANGESAFTMSRYGDKRSFSDQEHGRLVTIERHLTYRGSSGGLQIYFDKDDATDTFIVGYIGEHLPYATNRS